MSARERADARAAAVTEACSRAMLVVIVTTDLPPWGLLLLLLGFLGAQHASFHFIASQEGIT